MNKERFLDVGKFCDALSPISKSLFLSHAEDFQQVADEIIYIAEKKLDSVQKCLDCGGGCCKLGDLEDKVISAPFLTIVHSLCDSDVKKNILSIIESNQGVETHCVLLADQGCALPKNTKPLLCTTFFCEKHFSKEESIFRDINFLKKELRGIFADICQYYVDIVLGKNQSINQ